jgi:short-subunit dehydrogenase
MDAIPAIMWLDAQAVAEAGYAAVEANRPVCITGWPNRAIAALCKLLPEGLLMAMTRRAARRIRTV